MSLLVWVAIILTAAHMVGRLGDLMGRDKQPAELVSAAFFTALYHFFIILVLVLQSEGLA